MSPSVPPVILLPLDDRHPGHHRAGLVRPPRKTLPRKPGTSGAPRDFLVCLPFDSMQGCYSSLPDFSAPPAKGSESPNQNDRYNVQKPCNRQGPSPDVPVDGELSSPFRGLLDEGCPGQVASQPPGTDPMP